MVKGLELGACASGTVTGYPCDEKVQSGRTAVPGRWFGETWELSPGDIICGNVKKGRDNKKIEHAMIVTK